MKPADEERIRRLLAEGDIVGDVATLTSAAREMLDDIAAIADSQWNAALLALGRRWRAWMMIYTPEELHDLNKAIYALWRGDGLGDDRSQQPENEKVCDAISAGLKAEP